MHDNLIKLIVPFLFVITILYAVIDLSKGKKLNEDFIDLASILTFIAGAIIFYHAQYIYNKSTISSDDIVAATRKDEQKAIVNGLEV